MNEANNFKYDATAKMGNAAYGSNMNFQEIIPFKQIGNISFNYGMKTISFGAGIDEPEVKHILNTLVEKNILSANQIVLD